MHSHSITLLLSWQNSKNDNKFLFIDEIQSSKNLNYSKSTKSIILQNLWCTFIVAFLWKMIDCYCCATYGSNCPCFIYYINWKTHVGIFSQANNFFLNLFISFSKNWNMYLHLYPVLYMYILHMCVCVLYISKLFLFSLKLFSMYCIF